MFETEKTRGTPDVSVPIMVTDTDGIPDTTYDHASTGLDLWYRREGGARVAITEAALASWGAAHTDGGVEHGSDGRGRLDLPDAACAVGTDGASYVEYGGAITGGLVFGGIVHLRLKTGLSGTLSGTHSTTSADLGANAPSTTLLGQTLYFPGLDESRVIETYDTGTGVASWTRALASAPSDDDPWQVFPTARVDTLTLADLNAEVDTALWDYDAPTRAEATADRDAVLGRIGSPSGASVSADIAAVDADVGTLLSRVTAGLFSGITSLGEWLGAIAGKQSPDSTAQAELRATGAGSGTYDATADSQEALRDRGDASWVTGGGGSGGATAAQIADAVLEELLGDHDAVSGSLAEGISDLKTVQGLLQSALVTAQTDLDTLTGADGATLATAQGNYAPAKAGDEMDLVDAPNAAAVTDIQAGLSTFDAGVDTVGVAGLDAAALQQIVDDLEDAGRLDALLDAIKAKTDQLTFTKASELDANVQSMNGVTLVGAGTPGDNMRAGS